jgi:PST family polysaccharide transporter
MAEAEHKAPVSHADTSLTGRGLHALKWNMAGTVGGMLLQFGIGILLARILGPEPYGIIAIAWLVLGLGNLLAEGGLGAALVQKDRIDERDVREVFSTQLLAGLVLAAIVASSAEQVAQWFRNEYAVDMLQTMALVFVIQPLGLTAAALMRRELRFKRLQITRIGSYLVGYFGVGLPLALEGQGVWSLVFAQLAQVLLFSLAIYLQSRHPLWPLVLPHRARLLGFGAAVTGSNLSSYAISYIDTLIIGRFFSAAHLGLYNRAYNLLAMPMNALTTGIQGVLFAACSRNQHDHQGLKRAYLGSITAISLLILPPFAVVAAVPETVLLGIYGEKWAEAIELLPPLALAMALNAVLAISGPVLTAMGLARREFLVQLVALMGMVVLLLWAADGGELAQVAWAVLVAYALRLILLAVVTIRALQASVAALGRALLPAMIVAPLLAIVSTGFDRGLTHWLDGPASRLLGMMLLCGLAYLVLLAGARSWIVSGSTREALDELGPHLPGPFRAWAGVRA